jgi:DNA primase
MAWVDFLAVKQAVSLEVVLRRYQVRGLRRRRDQLQGRCPIHRGEREDSFRASLSKNAFHCFACQAGGNVLDFVAAMERCSIREAALRLQQWFDMDGPATSGLPYPTVAEAEERELVRKKEPVNPPLRFTLTAIDPTHPYLMKRGIDRATAAQFGVGFYAGPGLLSGRLVIPIHNRHGAIVAYVGRAVNNKEWPKYRLPVGFRKGLELFHLHRALVTGSKTAIVVEGYFDCMRVYQADLPWVVGLMGSSLSVEQEKALLQHFSRVVLMLDGDATGRAATRTIAARLQRNCSVNCVPLHDGMQPDQLPPTDIRRLIDNAERVQANLGSTQHFPIRK